MQSVLDDAERSLAELVQNIVVSMDLVILRNMRHLETKKEAVEAQEMRTCEGEYFSTLFLNKYDPKPSETVSKRNIRYVKLLPVALFLSLGVTSATWSP